MNSFSSSRAEILARIRAANSSQSASMRERGVECPPRVPLFTNAQPGSQWSEKFSDNLVKMGGKILFSPHGDPLREVRKLLMGCTICSAVPEVEGTLELKDVHSPKDIAGVDYGIIRGAFGVAETGSVCLTEENLHVNALGYLPQHLIIFLDPEDIVYNLHQAYQRPEWKKGHYAVFHSGPSATADIEGVLVHGAQGVRTLSVAFVPRSV